MVFIKEGTHRPKKTAEVVSGLVGAFTIQGKKKDTGFDKLLKTKERRLTKLRALLAKNPKMSRGEAAAALGVSLRTVDRDILRVGHQRLWIEDEMREKQRRITEMMKLVKNNPILSRRKLALLLGVSDRTLARYLKELGAPFQDLSPKAKQLRIEKLNAYWRENPTATRKELCALVGVSPRTLGQYIKKGGVHP